MAVRAPDRRRARGQGACSSPAAPAASAARSRSPSRRPARAWRWSTSARRRSRRSSRRWRAGRISRSPPICSRSPATPALVDAVTRRPSAVSTFWSAPPPCWCAGPASFDVSEADWDIQHDVNLKATFFLNQAVGRMMREQGRGGRIINFTSQGWQSGGFGGSVAYAAIQGRHRVDDPRPGAARWPRTEITVNAVSPGAADTAMMRSGMDEAALAGTVARSRSATWPQPSELAGTVLFLASDHAGYITGATINVSGGWLMY